MKIKSKKLIKNKNFLELCSINGKNESVICNANKIERKCIYEILLNILNGNVHLTEDKINEFKKFKNIVRMLANKRVCDKKKVKVINQKGKGAFLPILLSVLPAVIHQIISKL